MAPLAHPLFLTTEMEILHPGGVLPTHGWASLQGVSRLRLPMGLSQAISHTGDDLKIRIGEALAQIILVQQFGAGGLSHGARFTAVCPDHQTYLQDRIEKEGVHPPWRRRLERFDAAEAEARQLSYPKEVELVWQGIQARLEILNFTEEGLRLLWPEAPSGLRVGHLVSFSLYTRQGEAVQGLSAEVRNFNRVQLPGAKAITEVGVQLKDLHRVAKGPYGRLLEPFRQGSR